MITRWELWAATCDPNCSNQWCTVCCWSKQGRHFLHNRPDLDWSVRMSIKREVTYIREKASANGSPMSGKLAAPVELERSYPALAQYMTALVFPQGGLREPSTVTLCVEDGKLKGCVNDRANEASLWRSADTVAELLAALEAALEDPRSTWRDWSKGFRSRKRD